MSDLSLLDDRYDALSHQETIKSTEEDAVEENASYSQQTFEVAISHLQALQSICYQNVLEEGLCVKSSVKKKFSWDSLYQPSDADAEDAMMKDNTTLASLLPARRDPYFIYNGDTVSSLEFDSSGEAKDNEEEESEEEEEKPSSLDMSLPNDSAERNLEKDDHFASLWEMELETNATGESLIDQKLTIEVGIEDASTDDEEKMSYGISYKCRTTKELSAFQSMMKKLGLNQDEIASVQDGKCSPSRTDRGSFHSFAQAEDRANLDVVFTLNTPMFASVHSGTTFVRGGEGNSLKTHGEENDDDSSAWFGFKENCNPTVGVLLVPVSSSRTDDDAEDDDFTTDLFSLEQSYDADSEEDEPTDGLTAALQSLVLRSDKNLFEDAKQEARNEVVDLFEKSKGLIMDVAKLVTPKCGISFFSEESEMPSPNVEDWPEDLEGSSSLSGDGQPIEQGIYPLVDEEVVEYISQPDRDDENCVMIPIFDFVGIPSCVAIPQVPRLCCGCNRVPSDLDATFDVADDNESIVARKTKTKQKEIPVLGGCRNHRDHTSDEEDEGGVAILVNDEQQSRSHKYDIDHEQVDLLFRQYVCNEMERIEQHIQRNGSEGDMKSLLDDPDFELGAILEDEHSGSEDDSVKAESQTQSTMAAPTLSKSNDDWAFFQRDSFSIDAAPSSDSLCIPAPPIEDADRLEVIASPLDSLSCDSFVLSSSSADINAPPVLQECTSIGNESSSHRRRHTLDHIPSYHTYFDFKKPVVLPFLLKDASQKYGGFHNAQISALPSSPKKEVLSIRTSCQANSSPKSRADAPSDAARVASHKRNELPSSVATCKDIRDENTPTIENITESSDKKSCSPLKSHVQGAGAFVVRQSDSLVSSFQQRQVRKSSTTMPKSPQRPVLEGILRKTGAKFGSGRRISWNEEQLAEKEDKGILYYSGRADDRSVCPLDALVLKITKVEVNLPPMDRIVKTKM